MKKFLYLVVGCLLMAMAVNFIVVPNEIVAGGVSGLATVLTKQFGIDKDIFILVVNALLLIYAFFFISKQYATKSLLGSIILFPLFLFILPEMQITDDNLLAAILCGTLTGTAVFCLYMGDGSTGGTTIVGMIIHKYLKVNYGTSVAIADGFIIATGLLAFGLEQTLYAFVSIAVMTIVADYLEGGVKKIKVINILCTDKDKVEADLKNLISNISIVPNDNKKMFCALVGSTELKIVKHYVEENNLSIYTTTATSTYGESLSVFENAGK